MHVFLHKWANLQPPLSVSWSPPGRPDPHLRNQWFTYKSKPLEYLQYDIKTQKILFLQVQLSYTKVESQFWKLPYQILGNSPLWWGDMSVTTNAALPYSFADLHKRWWDYLKLLLEFYLFYSCGTSYMPSNQVLSPLDRSTEGLTQFQPSKLEE